MIEEHDNTPDEPFTEPSAPKIQFLKVSAVKKTLRALGCSRVKMAFIEALDADLSATFRRVAREAGKHTVDENYVHARGIPPRK